MILKNYFEKALTYHEYVLLLKENLPLHQLHYRKFCIPESRLETIKNLDSFTRILVITEPWCSDSLALLPIVRKMCEIRTDWELKIALRDQHPKLMNLYLSDGSRGIPIFLFLDEKFEAVTFWGPRPEQATKIFAAYRSKIESGRIEKKEVIKKIRRYYAEDRGRISFIELLTRLAGIKKSALTEIE